MSHTNTIIIKLVIPICLTLSALESLAQSEIFKDIYAILINPVEGKEEKLNPDSTLFSTRKFVVNENKLAAEILEESGFYPDAESFNLIFKLNPQLTSLILKPKMIIDIPVINSEGNANIHKALKEGFVVAVTTDFQIKKEIIGLSKALPEKIGLYEVAHLNTQNKCDSLIATANTTARLLDALRIMINGRTRPLNLLILKQVRDESIIVDSLLSLENGQTNSDLVELLKSINSNMKIRSGILEEIRGPGLLPEPYPEQNFVVKVLTAEGKETRGLRIYFVPPALINYPSKIGQLPELSSPTLGRLPVANYRIWAGKPGNSAAMTDVFPLEIRKSNENIIVELVLK